MATSNTESRRNKLIASKQKAGAAPRPSRARAPQSDVPAVIRISSIPDFAKYAQGYVRRSLAVGVSDFILFDRAFANGENVLLEGPTQSGKTSAIYAWAATRKHHLYSISSQNGAEYSQLFGRPQFMPDGTVVWTDGPVTDIVRHGGVLLINEFNFLPERLQTVLFSLLDKRREIQLLDRGGEVIRVHDGGDDCWCGVKDCDKGVIIFVDMNPDYRGTHRLNFALRARFKHQLVWDYDRKVEEQLVPSKNLLDMADALRARVKTGEFETPTGTGMLIEFVENYEWLGYQYARQNFVNHYNDDERDPIAKVFDTYGENIKVDLKSITQVTPYGGKTHTREGDYYEGDWKYEWDVIEEDEEIDDEEDEEEDDFDFGEEEDD